MVELYFPAHFKLDLPQMSSERGMLCVTWRSFRPSVEFAISLSSAMKTSSASDGGGSVSLGSGVRGTWHGALADSWSEKYSFAAISHLRFGDCLLLQHKLIYPN